MALGNIFIGRKKELKANMDEDVVDLEQPPTLYPSTSEAAKEQTCGKLPNFISKFIFAKFLFTLNFIWNYIGKIKYKATNHNNILSRSLQRLQTQNRPCLSAPKRPYERL
jgi:hypothetical protein